MATLDIKRFLEVLSDPTIKSAVVILPQNQTLDQAAAGLALSLALEKNGQSTVVSAPSAMTVEFNRLVNVNRVRQDLGDKNLLITFDGYPAEAVERVAYNIEDGKFMLTIIPKPGNTAPRQNQIKSSYSGLGSDLVIVVGANYPQDLGKFAEIKELTEQKNLVLVGNRPLAGWPAALELIDTNAASVSEVVQEIIEAMQIPVDEDLATNLYLGIEAGSANFTSSQVSAQTFTRAADLLSRGARRNQPMPNTQSFQAQPRRNPQAPPAPDVDPQFREGGVA